jgi:hypothetical protein
MSKTKRKRQESEHRKQLASLVKGGLIFVISILSVLLFVLIFKVGESYWPIWLMNSRGLLAAIISFITIFLILLSPVIIEMTSNPRVLSGPGDTPTNMH